jgi:hypothetical protein
LKNIVRLVLLGTVVMAGVWLWLFLFPSPEKVIVRQFAKLARAASARPGEGALPRLIGAQTVGNFFATSVEINIDLPAHQRNDTLTRDDVVQAVMAIQSSGGMTIKFPDVNVTVGPGAETAEADVTVEAQVQGEQDMMVQEMKFTLRKIDGKWLITRVQTVRTLS